MQNAVGLNVALKNILIAVDFSFPSDVLLSYANSIARQYGGKLFLAHVIPPDYYHVNPIKDVAAYKCSRKLDALGKAANLDVDYEVMVGTGEAVWPNLLELGTEIGVDLVVAGTSGKTGLKKLVLGSAAEQIFRHAPCPVLTVGPTVAKGRTDIDYILYASDLQNEGPTGIYAASLAKRYNARLTLLHVSKTGPDATVSTRLLERISGGEQVPSAPELIIETGDPAERIVKVANAKNVDLIVLGTHRNAMFASHTMHTAYKVLCEAHCPVFTVGIKS